MSAYIVDDRTINRILAGIRYAQYGHTDYAPWPTAVMGCERRDFCCDCGSESAMLVTFGPLGVRLREMNEAAVRARYNDADEADMIPGPYEYEYVPNPTVSQLYKSLGCYLYQCSEGDIPEDPLFKALEDWWTQIAHHIAHTSEAVAAAEWG